MMLMLMLMMLLIWTVHFQPDQLDQCLPPA